MKSFCSLLVCAFLSPGIAAAQRTNQAKESKAKIKIELLYFASCPASKETLAALEAALEEKKLKADIELVEVETDEKAEQVGFQGSPSIRVNGKDLEGRDEGFSFSCRIYQEGGKPRAVPSKEYISKKLDALIK